MGMEWEVGVDGEPEVGSSIIGKERQPLCVC